MYGDDLDNSASIIRRLMDVEFSLLKDLCVLLMLAKPE
ncbi:MAG: hypothetical protein ACJAWS_001506 [Oleiphilaceae bacterium]|jgi:hypothetical protein